MEIWYAQEGHQEDASDPRILSAYKNLEQSSLYSYLLGCGQMGPAQWQEGPACCLSSSTVGQAAGNVYLLPQSPCRPAQASVNKQSCAVSASHSLAFSVQLLLLLFLINMPELFRHLLLCYLWFVNMMFAGRKKTRNSARAVSAGRVMC